MQQFVVVINVCLCRLGIAFHVGSLRLEEMAQLICSFYVPFIQYTMNHMFACLCRNLLCSSHRIIADIQLCSFY
uniref:Putative ovule protein n=1 Tax=Solanum chacoense TaxID=4108 RepID=A0A0V0HBM9_SOLCH